MKNNNLNSAGNWLIGIGCLLPILFITGALLFSNAPSKNSGNRAALSNDMTVMMVYLNQQPGRRAEWPYMNEDDSLKVTIANPQNAHAVANSCADEFARLRAKDGYTGNIFVSVYDREENKLASASRP